MILASCLVGAVSSAAVLETTVGRFALLDRWERTAVAFGESIDDSRYAAMGRASEYGSLYAAASAFATGPVLAIVLSGLLFLSFRTPASAAVTYRHVLAVVAHASVILALRQVVAAPLVYARETLASPLTLRPLFSGLDEASLPVRFASAIDLFVVWWIVVLALGISVLYRRGARGLTVRFLGRLHGDRGDPCHCHGTPGRGFVTRRKGLAPRGRPDCSLRPQQVWSFSPARPMCRP